MQRGKEEKTSNSLRRHTKNDGNDDDNKRQQWNLSDCTIGCASHEGSHDDWCCCSYPWLRISCLCIARFNNLESRRGALRQRRPRNLHAIRSICLSDCSWTRNVVGSSLGDYNLACFQTCSSCTTSHARRKTIWVPAGKWATCRGQFDVSSLGLFHFSLHWRTSNWNVSMCMVEWLWKWLAFDSNPWFDRMLAHHILAAAVSYFSLEYQYLHYYGSKFILFRLLLSRWQWRLTHNRRLPCTVFYLGLSEVSSIFLVLINLAQHFPPTPGSPFHLFVDFICGPLFVVTFFYYRVLLWWKVNWQLWQDAFSVISSGMAEKLRPKKSFVLYLFLACNVPLSILQLYWFWLICGESAKVVTSVLPALQSQ